MNNVHPAVQETSVLDHSDNTLKMVLGLTFLGDLRTRDAWLALEERNQMDEWTSMVHRHVFEVLLPLRTAAVVTAITATADSCDRVLVSTFRGMLSYKLPVCKLKVTQTDGQKRRVAILASAIVTNVLIDEGLLVVTKEKVVTPNGTREYHYVTFTKVNFKDKLHGVMPEPGVVLQKSIGGLKPVKAQKDFLKLLSDQPFMVHSELSSAVLNKFYTLKDDWDKSHDKNGNKIKWVGAFKRKHYKDMAVEVMELQDCIYYLAFKYDHRLRVGPEGNRLEGINAHGKTFETIQHCSADKHNLGEGSLSVLVQQLYSAREHRVGLVEASAVIKNHHFTPVTEDVVLASTSQKEMANLWVVKKALESIEHLQAGEDCGNLFGWDFTFSGGIMAGLLFKSPEFLQSGNLYGSDEITDAHARFGELFGIDLDRDTVKSMQQPVMHGGHISGLVNTITEHGYDMTEDEVHSSLVRVYGESVVNIDAIAQWGATIAHSEYSTMRWTMPDGMIASHKAYQSGVAVENYVASASHKSGYAHTIELTDLPYETTRTGKPLYAKEMLIGKTTHKVKTHLRGLFADILHSVDAYVLRRMVQAIRATGMPILVKHDNFYIHPSSYPLLMATAKEVFKELLASDLLSDILNEIAVHSHVPAVAPEIVYGEAEDRIEESNLFLLP
jgi:hypothetical protein